MAAAPVASQLPCAFTPHIYEIHGNVFYMHCSDEKSDHAQKFVAAPSLSEVKNKASHVPLCAECSLPMKPHCMFFDESYNEWYYR